MKRLVEATDDKIVSFAKSIYKVDVEDPNSTPWKGGHGSPLRGIVAAKAGLGAQSSGANLRSDKDKGAAGEKDDDTTEDRDWREKLQRAETKHSAKMAAVQEQYRTLGLHQPGTPDPIPISRGTVFASHLTTVHRHIRHFEHLLRWWLSDRTFPFAHHWIKQLLGAEVEDKDALEMMRTSAKTKSKTLQTEEARLLNINAYTELEESIIAHLNSVFLMLFDAGPLAGLGMGSRMSDGNSLRPVLSGATSMVLDGGPSDTGEAFALSGSVAPPIAASLAAQKGSSIGGSTVIVGADLPEVKFPEPPSIRPSTAAAQLRRKPDRPGSGIDTQTSTAKASSVTNAPQGEVMINLGISRVVCRPGSASAAQGSSVSIRPPSAGSSVGGAAAHSPRLQHDSVSTSLRRGSTEESPRSRDGAGAVGSGSCGWQLLQEEPAQPTVDTNPSQSKGHSIRSPRSIMIAIAQRSGLSTHLCGIAGGREGPKGMDTALLPAATSTATPENTNGGGTARPGTAATRFTSLQTKHLKQHEPVTGTVEANNGVKAIQLSPRNNQRPASAREAGTLWSFGRKPTSRPTTSDSTKGRPSSQSRAASSGAVQSTPDQPVEASTETVLTGGLADVGPLPIDQNPEALSAWGAHHPHWGPSRDLKWINGGGATVHQSGGKVRGPQGEAGHTGYRVM